MLNYYFFSFFFFYFYHFFSSIGFILYRGIFSDFDCINANEMAKKRSQSI